jgi:hypothetical protein
VNSTEGRAIFPKGHLFPEEVDSAVEAAARIAKREAGARGRFIEGKSKHIIYYNEAASAVHRIELFLLETTQVLLVEPDWRKPKWYKLQAAITTITQKRDYNTSHNLAQAMEWADEEIRSYLREFATTRCSGN